MFDGASQDFEFGSFRLRTGDGVLLKNGEVVALTPKAFQILILLVRQHGKLITKDEIMREVWADTFVEESSIIRNISVLRKILLDDASNCYIETFHRRGYRFVAPMREIAAEMPTEIAVLPFAMLNSDAEYEHLGIGLADTLTTHLSRFREIIVRPTSAVINYAAAPDIFAAGKQLSVQAVLSGSIQFSRESLRVNLQFVSIESRRLIWGANIDGQLNDILKVQDEISRQVVKMLLPQTFEIESDSSVTKQTADSEAYQLYLRGRFYWNKRSPENIQKAISYLNRTVEKDPHYALAHAALADCFLVAAHYDAAVEYSEENRHSNYEQARQAAEKALEIDPTLGEAVTALAHVCFLDEWNFPEAEILYLKAIELKPNYSTARHWYASFLAAFGRFDESLREMRKALALDFLSPMINRSLGILLTYAGRYTEAALQFEATLEIEPYYIPAIYGYAILHTLQGDFAAARKMLENAAAITPDSRMVLSGKAYIQAAAGQHAETLVLPEEMRSTKIASQISPVDYATIYNYLGETEKTFEWLESAYQERDIEILFLKVYPEFRNLHADERFVLLAKRIGLDK